MAKFTGIRNRHEERDFEDGEHKCRSLESAPLFADAIRHMHSGGS
jgi:hypothetical protein